MREFLARWNEAPTVQHAGKQSGDASVSRPERSHTCYKRALATPLCRTYHRGASHDNGELDSEERQACVSFAKLY